MKTVFRIPFEIIFGLWLGVYFLLFFLYVLVWFEKLGFPYQKIIDWDNFIAIGIFLFLLLILNIIIFLKMITIKKAQLKG